jgi:hypothetical protein
MQIHAMKRFMDAATPAEKESLAELAGTSKGQLYQLVGGAAERRNRCGPDLAKRIELGAAKLRKKNPALPPLSRMDLCEACRACEFAKQCAARS